LASWRIPGTAGTSSDLGETLVYRLRPKAGGGITVIVPELLEALGQRHGAFTVQRIGGSGFLEALSAQEMPAGRQFVGKLLHANSFTEGLAGSPFSESRMRHPAFNLRFAAQQQERLLHAK
jgi:hypothetical protein